jgi:hypothetical protein
MDLVQFVDTRRKRYLAHSLEQFERSVERELKRQFNGTIPREARDAIEDFKVSVRKDFQRFAEDFTDILGATLSDVAINDVAIELRDRVRA